MKNILCTLVALALLPVLSKAQLPSYLPTSGLVAWFPFTGNAIDSTMNGHNGTVFGTSNAKGRFGQPNTAFRFNGTSDYIYVPAGVFDREISIDITSSLTISAWVKSYNYFYSGQMQIYWRGDATPAHDPHMLYLNGGQVRIRRDIDPGATVNEVGSSLSGLDTNYHMFTGTYDSASGIMRIYVDGTLRNSAYLPGFQTYPTSTMYNYIGAVDGGTWQFFYGFIDELGIWNRALTACEVATLYHSLPSLIITNPSNDTVTTGGSTNFSVATTSSASSYRWQVNTGSGFTNLANVTPYAGVATSNLSVNPVTPSLSGNIYRCLVTVDSCINVASGTATLIVDTVTTIVNEGSVAQGLVVSPNPGSGNFTFTGLTPNGDYSLQITDLTGRVVYNEQFIAHKNESKGIDLLMVPCGIYLLRLHSQHAPDEVRKIVVER